MPKRALVKEATSEEESTKSTTSGQGDSKRAKDQSAVDIIREDMAALQKAYSSIKYGSDWKSEKTQDAVKKLEELDFLPVYADIANHEQPTERLELALEMTTIAAKMILGAQDWGYKRVNGSMGEWCPDRGQELEDFWREIVDLIEEDYTPPEHVLAEIKSSAFSCGLEDYGYCDLSFVVEAVA
jgi:hypothetical protein